MPRIDDKLLDCVVYLYQTEDDAREGQKSGGCGFWVGVPSESLGSYWHTYIVTNRHLVLDEPPCPVLRINRSDGGFDILRTEPKYWLEHPDSADLAIYKLDPQNEWKHLIVPRDLLVTGETLADFNIGPGDDTVTISRFVSHDGRQTNTPAARFGNISMMPIEPLVGKSCAPQESFLVETRALSGSSGSPVFLRMPFEIFGRDGAIRQEPRFRLLGVNWGVVNLVDVDYDFVLDQKWQKTDYRVNVPTGMMAVVPSWKLLELLDHQEISDQRLDEEARFVNASQRTRVMVKETAFILPGASDVVETLDIRRRTVAGLTGGGNEKILRLNGPGRLTEASNTDSPGSLTPLYWRGADGALYDLPQEVSGKFTAQSHYWLGIAGEMITEPPKISLTTTLVYLGYAPSSSRVRLSPQAPVSMAK